MIQGRNIQMEEGLIIMPLIHCGAAAQDPGMFLLAGPGLALVGPKAPVACRGLLFQPRDGGGVGGYGLP